MAIYQSLTSHLTTPLPPNHRLSISSVSSMLSVNSTSSQLSISTPTSPSSVRRVGSGKTDPHQRSIRFLLNKKIRRTGSGSSIPGTPTTPTTPTTPMSPMHQQDDIFWVKVVCLGQELPETMTIIDGMPTALEKTEPRAQGQIRASKIEHWLPMQSTSNAGDVVFKALERIAIRAGVVDGVPEHIIAAKRSAIQDGIVIEYQLGLRLNTQSSRRAKQGDEVPLPPQMSLIRCFEEHQLTPVRRSPKADVASMPPAPDYVFYLRKSAKSLEAELDYADQQQKQQQLQAQQSHQDREQSKRGLAPLQAQALHSSTANDSPRSPSQSSPTGISSIRSLRNPRSIEDINRVEPGSPGMGPYQTSRTTPDHHVVGGRNRSASVSQSSRPGQIASPIPSNISGTEYDNTSRSSTPERPLRAERTDRQPAMQQQRAMSPSMTHGPSPLSLASLTSQDNNNGAVAMNKDALQNQRLDSKIGPVSIKKNSTQGTDIVLNKGVIRSSRLMNSKKYRYSFIPEGGDEVDISEIIEDILGEEDDYGDADDDDKINRGIEQDHFGIEGDVASSRSPIRPIPSGTSDRGNTMASAARDRLEVLAGSTRGSNTLMRLERVLAGDDEKRSTSAQPRIDSPPRSQSQQQAKHIANKRDSDVEIQVASVTSLHTRSASPIVSEQPPSARAFANASDASAPGSPRSLRPTSPFGTTAKPTLLSGTNSSPLKEGSITADLEASTAQRSFSPIPRRLQSPSPAALKQQQLSQGNSSPRSSSPNQRPDSPSSGGGRSSPGMAPSRLNPDGSVSPSFNTNRNRSVSASAVTEAQTPSRLAQQLGSPNIKNIGTASLNSSGKEWLLSSDYNAGMQDLLTLVRAGRSSSVSSLSGPPMHHFRGTSPLIGKDGKVVTLPSTIKASLINGSALNRNRSPSLPQLYEYSDTQQHDKQLHSKDNILLSLYDNKHPNDNNNTNSYDRYRNDEQTRMMLMMLNELTLKDVQRECHPDVYECWKDVDADLDRVERELDELLVTVKASAL
ncbi:hypothetical protein BCR41DRAFT_55839 [Lobosporangium transversale]|uniref:Uncharacterized protein n=1 Tax=Lobosporangium transversale TaxID=64571 RepID=A0A1Y2GNY9_9FUNG|nr:hypothetical protein BCR41DRAFT_55839 [Lobosporangium transversale]ORZ16768.1 hypothetical protein BCR41DRAFT_55839 [Lobosporangium transversale]|eukprot:XP_021881703.1 hypothetical protein BCR41DRAFT_55839 [Lobosporangium transversale]